MHQADIAVVRHLSGRECLWTPLDCQTIFFGRQFTVHPWTQHECVFHWRSCCITFTLKTYMCHTKLTVVWVLASQSMVTCGSHSMVTCGSCLRDECLKVATPFDSKSNFLVTTYCSPMWYVIWDKCVPNWWSCCTALNSVHQFNVWEIFCITVLQIIILFYIWEPGTPNRLPLFGIVFGIWTS